MCSWCGLRPRRKGQIVCYQCGKDRDTVVKESPSTERRNWWADAARILVWKGHVIVMAGPHPGCLGECGNGRLHRTDMLAPRYEGMRPLAKDGAPKGAPAGLVINLDVWLPHFRREQVKAMKRVFRPYVTAGIEHRGIVADQRQKHGKVKVAA